MLKNIVPQDVTENFTKPLFSPDNMRYKITSVTFSLTAKTTQSYSTHKYSTTLPLAIIHTILTVKVMICVPEDFPTLNLTRYLIMKYKAQVTQWVNNWGLI